MNEYNYPTYDGVDIDNYNVSKYNLVYTTNNIYLTQKQGGGASKKIIDGGCSGRYSPSI